MRGQLSAWKGCTLKHQHREGNLILPLHYVVSKCPSGIGRILGKEVLCMHMGSVHVPTFDHTPYKNAGSAFPFAE